jgi:hypothetical protein
MPVMGMSILGDVLLKKQLMFMAAKTGVTAATLTTRMAKEMAELASSRCPVNSGRLQASIQTSGGGLNARAEVGRGIPYTYYAEFYITKGGEIREPSGRFWYPSLGDIKTRLRSGGLLDRSFNELTGEVHY